MIELSSCFQAIMVGLVLRNDWVVLLCSGYDDMTGAWEWLSCPVFRIWCYDWCLGMIELSSCFQAIMVGLVLRNDWVVLLCSGYDDMTGAWEWLSCPPVFRLWWYDWCLGMIELSSCFQAIMVGLVLRNDWVVLLCSGYDDMTGAWEWLSCPPVFRLWWYDWCLGMIELSSCFQAIMVGLVLRNDWVVLLCSGYDDMTGAWEWLSCPPVFRLWWYDWCLGMIELSSCFQAIMVGLVLRNDWVVLLCSGYDDMTGAWEWLSCPPVFRLWW